MSLLQVRAHISKVTVVATSAHGGSPSTNTGLSPLLVKCSQVPEIPLGAVIFPFPNTVFPSFQYPVNMLQHSSLRTV